MNRSIRYHGCLGLLFGLGVTGCAGMKSTGLGPRTTPSIGDRQLGVVSGRPGEETIIRTNTASTPIDNRDVRRISGRVIDHRGQPVSGATVRLADGAANGGAVSDVITDEAGGFTVRGLRASTPYTVIATLDLGGETRVARARFLAGETQARLLLEPNIDGSLAARPTPVPAQAKPNVADAQPPSPPKGRWVFVEEDGDEITTVAVARQDSKVRRTSETASEPESPEPPANPKPARKKIQNKQVNSDWRANDQANTRVIRDPAVQPAQFIADGESNPLPPAIERKPYVYEEFDEEPRSPQAPRMASRDLRVTDGSGPRPLPEDLVPITEVPSAEELMREARGNLAQPAQREPARTSSRSTQRLYTDAPAAGSLRVEQIEEYNRMRRAQLARERGEPVPDEPEPVAMPARSVTWDQAADGNSRPPARTDRTINRTNRSVDSIDAVRNDDYSARAESAPPTRGLERSLAKRDAIERTLDNSRRDSLVAQIEPDVARTDQERIDRLRSDDKSQSTAFHGDTPKSPNEWMTRMTNGMAWWKKPASTGLTTEPTGIFCDFDATNQRIIDFELPDVKGRPVRFGQLPANLTLIVFWGTWCKPCHEIMPHLVELQRRLESDNVQIIGISYEEGALAERQKKVALAADRYGINFPLLLGGKSGSEACPVRKSLGVQVYPTMILVDHNGRMLWRDTGSTPATMGRLDRVLASHLRELETRQVARSDQDRNR